MLVKLQVACMAENGCIKQDMYAALSSCHSVADSIVYLKVLHMSISFACCDTSFTPLNTHMHARVSDALKP